MVRTYLVVQLFLKILLLRQQLLAEPRELVILLHRSAQGEIIGKGEKASAMCIST